MVEGTRKFDRAPLPIAAQCRRVNDMTPTWQTIEVLDLSAEGVGFVINDFVEVGERVHIKLQLPMARACVEIFALVRQEQPSNDRVRVGAEFIDTTPEQRAAIDDLVQFLSKAPPS